MLFQSKKIVFALLQREDDFFMQLLQALYLHAYAETNKDNDYYKNLITHVNEKCAIFTKGEVYILLSDIY